MLHNETRKLLMKAWDKTNAAKEIEECFCVDTSTVYCLVKRMRETGSVNTRVSLRGRKPFLGQTDIQNIDWLVQERLDITIHKISEKLWLRVSDETVCKAVVKLGYVYKKKSLHASEQECPRCQGQEEGMEKTYAREWCKQPCIFRRKRRQHQYDKTLHPFKNKWACHAVPQSCHPYGWTRRHSIPFIREGQQRSVLWNIWQTP